MKRKLATLLLALSCIFGLTGLAACDKEESSSPERGWGTTFTVETAYAQAQELGYSGSLEDFIALISGKDGIDGNDGIDGTNGVGITTISINADGELFIALTDGRNLSLGKIVGKDGENGKSAYELYKEKYDYTGTESEWLDDLANGRLGTSSESDSKGSEGLAYTISEDESYYIVRGLGMASDRKLVIPDTYKNKPVKEIADNAFESCVTLTSITIPDSIQSIGFNAFGNCSNLTSITIPDSVQSIEEWAFYNCSNLTSVTIPDSVQSIGERAFYNCSNLTSVTIPDSVQSIGDEAFLGCTQILQKENGVYYVDKWVVDCDNSVTSLSLRSHTKGIGDNAFYTCSNLTSVTIPDSVQTIGAGAFSYCFNLTSIAIPDSVQTIGERAFYNCSNLTSVTIRNSVQTIGEDAFFYCPHLTSVYYHGTESEWNEVSIGDVGNDYLTSAARYYYSETEQAGCWHYDTDGVTPVLW